MKKYSKLQKRAKPILVMLIGMIPVVLLSGCSTASPSNPINADSPGIFNHYFIYPFSTLIQFFADAFHGDCGLSIVLTLGHTIGLDGMSLLSYRNAKTHLWPTNLGVGFYFLL
ncbi:hypothetical protein ACFPPD_20185 [Cohnella suwonensis]|uniref:Lipoprotein n=1 Tax=Cohnella suwonensis TaxID=696072 RepID=A0ABW0M0F3_9BACL